MNPQILSFIAVVAAIIVVTIRGACRVILGALSGIISERSGIVNIGIEGMMLCGAFAAYFVNVFLSDPSVPAIIQQEPVRLSISILAAVLIGATFAMLHALLSIRFKVDQIISGTVINILASGLTGYLYIGNSDVLSILPFVVNNPFSRDQGVLYYVGTIIFNKGLLTYFTFILVPLVGFALFRTTWGLRTRSVGENPRAADTLAIHLHPLQYTNLFITVLLPSLTA